MLNFFSLSKRNERIKYIATSFDNYCVFNFTSSIEIENGYVIFSQMDLSFLTDFFEFLYHYVKYFYTKSEITHELIYNTICSCFPQTINKTPIPSELFTLIDDGRHRVNDEELLDKGERNVYRLFDIVSDRLSSNNVISAVKFFFFLTLLDSIEAGNLNNVFPLTILNQTLLTQKLAALPNDDIPTENFNNLVFEDENAKNEIIAPIKSFLEKNTPETIYNHLCENIIGQDKAKKQISISVYYYLVKIANGTIDNTNNNVLMVGPSGCGKTEIIRTLQNFLPIPVIIYDVASLTSAGYKGDNKDNILRPLIQTDGIALVFLDEFDKICAPSYTSNGNNFTAETQGQLLSMIEGNSIPIDDGLFYINTKNTLFVAGGAYEGMKIEGRISDKPKQIGFSSSKESENKSENDYEVTVSDLIKYGLRTELAGRFSTIATLYPLTDEQLHLIVSKYISQFEKLINKKIHFDKNDINMTIKKSPLGCRHIKQTLNDILLEALYEAPNHKNAKTVKLKKNNDEFETIFK